MVILSYLLSLVSLVCWIMVLVKIFKDSVLHGVIGIITCGIWALIWGWIKAKEYKIEKIMMIWTAVIIVNIVLALMGVGAGLAGTE